MHFTKIISLLAAQGLLSNAFASSDSMEDGLYRHYIDANGEQQTERVDLSKMARSATGGPADQADGVYSHQIESNGAGQGRPVVPMGNSAKFVKRGATSLLYNAGATYGTDQDAGIVSSTDLRQAVAQLGRQCDQHDTKGAPGLEPWIKKGSSFSAVSGQVRVYVCNYDKNDQNCSSEELDDSMDEVSNQFGYGIAGWAWLKNWNKSYGSTIVSSEFCTGKKQAINAKPSGS